jgi:hypothetical protein
MKKEDRGADHQSEVKICGNPSRPNHGNNTGKEYLADSKSQTRIEL